MPGETTIVPYDDDAQVAVQNVAPEGQPPCTRVTVWLPSDGIEVDFTVKGCIDLRMFHNGGTPTEHREEDVDYMHVCDLDDFVSALLHAQELAREKWRPI